MSTRDFAPTDPDVIPASSREKRVRRRLTVGITAPGQGHVAGFTSNLALHGCSVGANRAFPTGTAVRLVIQLPDQERATVEGQVAWARKGAGPSLSSMGVRFTGECPQYISFLKRYHPDVFGKES